MKKNQKPTEIDAHFKYTCPKSSCRYDHWISLKEAQTKNFKIVCDCGFVFQPKRICKLKIVYSTHQKKIVPVEIADKPKIPIDLKDKCVTLLCGYGFTQDEAVLVLEKGFEKNPTHDVRSLIKYILQNLGELNVSN